MGLIQGIAPKGVRPRFMEGKKYRGRVMSDPETLRRYREWARINWVSHRTFWAGMQEEAIPLTDFASADIPRLEQSAGSGDVDALIALGTMRIEVGDLSGARSFWDRAAATGSAEGIMLAGCAAWQANDLASCQSWQVEAAQRGYASLAKDLAEL